MSGHEIIDTIKELTTKANTIDKVLDFCYNRMQSTKNFNERVVYKEIFDMIEKELDNE